MTICPECMRGFYCGQCTISRSPELDETVSSGRETENRLGEVSVPANQRVRRQKPDRAVTDQQSTGRKRAAKLYPLQEQLCEWHDASPTNPRGGGNPITFGCKEPGVLQQARHHGPDKNTLNNEPGNVHRICHYHHNNWHALNDPDYDWSKHSVPRRD